MDDLSEVRGALTVKRSAGVVEEVLVLVWLFVELKSVGVAVFFFVSASDFVFGSNFSYFLKRLL